VPSIEPTPSASLPRGAGGTPGGIGTFFLGLVMSTAGGYLLLNQVVVTGGWSIFGSSSRGGFGLTLLPLLAGICWLFYDGKSIVGWLLVALGCTLVLASILMNMSMVFRSATLFNVLVMLGLLFGGLGLVARSLRPHEPPPAG
jgi:hypothetical protein